MSAPDVVIPPLDIRAETFARILLREGRMADGRPPFIIRKERFLSNLRSTGKLSYKRYLASPLRYAGGKSLAVGMVVELLPDNVQRIASPFLEWWFRRDSLRPRIGFGCLCIRCL